VAIFSSSFTLSFNPLSILQLLKNGHNPEFLNIEEDHKFQVQLIRQRAKKKEKEEAVW